MENRNNGIYWRVTCSTDWLTLTPWSLDNKDMPYIGSRTSLSPSVVMFTIGPIAIIRVTIGD